MSSRVSQALLLGLLALGSYSNAVTNGFVLDDQRAVLANPCVTGPNSALGCAFTHDFWGRPGRDVGRTYRPLTVLSFALDRLWGGERAWPFHLTNILLHLAATLAVFAFLSALVPRQQVAAAAATAIFATLAAHTEAVAGIVGRADLLATVAVAGALALHLRRERPRAFELVVVPLLCCLGLLAHEVAILAPVFVVCCDWATRRRASLPLYAALALVTLAYFGLRLWVMGRLVGPPPDFLNNPAVAASYGERALFALASMTRGVSTILFPLDLSAEYGYAAITVPKGLTMQVITGLAVTLALGAGLLLGRRRSSLLAAGCGLLLFGLVLLSNGPVLMPTAFAERLLYLPSLGAAMALGGLLEVWSASQRRLRLVAGLCVVVVVANMAIGLHRNRDWRDPVALFASAARSCPRSARAQLNLGLALNRFGRHAAAIEPLRRALTIYPALNVARVELGMAHDMLGDAPRARALFERAHREAPTDRWVVESYVTFLLRHHQQQRAAQVRSESRRPRR